MILKKLINIQILIHYNIFKLEVTIYQRLIFYLQKIIVSKKCLR